MVPLFMKFKCLMAVLVAGSFVAGCAKEEPPPEPPPAEVAVIEVTPRTVTRATDLPGRVQPVRVAEVRARVPGILLKRNFREGSDVEAGDVLFEIDPAPLRAEVNSAEAALARAEANLQQARSQADRQRELVEIDAISRQQFEDATASQAVYEAEVIAARAALERAGLDLGYAQVTAPIAGHVGRAHVTEGALVGEDEATLMVVVQQLDPVYVDFTRSSTEALRLQRTLAGGGVKRLDNEGVAIAITLDDGTAYEHAGELLVSELTVDASTGAIMLRAEVPNPDRVLLPGMFVRAELPEAVHENALVVPQRAVTRGAGGKATVLVVNAENTVEQRSLELGPAVDADWLVHDGLDGGETIIVEGLQKVRPGDRVTSVPFGEAAGESAAPEEAGTSEQ